METFSGETTFVTASSFAVTIFVIIFLVCIIGETLTRKPHISSLYNITQYKEAHPTIKNITTSILSLKNEERGGTSVIYAIREHLSKQIITAYILNPDNQESFSTSVTINNKVFNFNWDLDDSPITIKKLSSIRFETIPASSFFPHSNIPKKIMQTYMGNFVGKNAYINLSRTALLNDDCQYHYFDNMKIYFYLNEYFDKKVMLAYNMMVPGAFKVDLFRLCWLYKEGGVYMDMSMEPIYSFSEIFSNIYEGKNLIFVKDRNNGIYNALIFSEKGNSTIKLLLDKICDEVISNHKNQIFGKSPLMYTGPKIIYSILSTLSENVEGSREYSIPMKFDGSCIKIISSATHNTIIYSKYKDYKADRQSIHYDKICKDNMQYSVQLDNPSEEGINPINGRIPFHSGEINGRIPFHCLNYNWVTVKLKKNIDTLGSKNYDFLQQRSFIHQYCPKKIDIYQNILDDFIREKYFILLYLEQFGGLYINPFIKYDPELLPSLKKSDYVYSKWFIYAEKPHMKLINDHLTYIEDKLQTGVYSNWVTYIELTQYEEGVYYPNAQYDMALLGYKHYSVNHKTNNRHLLDTLTTRR